MKKSVVRISVSLLLLLSVLLSVPISAAALQTSAKGTPFSGVFSLVDRLLGTAKTAVRSVAAANETLPEVRSVEGTPDCWSFSDGTLTFSGLTCDTVCAIEGEWEGNIVIDAGEYSFELELTGLSLTCSAVNPITVLSGEKVTLTAKKGTENAVTDKRGAIPDDELLYSAAIWSKVDLEIGGKGSLSVVSEHNNGIHTKDDLEVKNLTLTVDCKDNALKGNDSVEIKSGTVTLISRAGDGIKTVNTDVSAKGKQRGSVTLNACVLNIYAACDGIDAAFDVVIEEGAELTVFTEKYSEYTEETAEPDSQNSADALLRSGASPFQTVALDSVGIVSAGSRPSPRPTPPPAPTPRPGGNTEKSACSAKGIKAHNEVIVNGGVIDISAGDDGIHAKNDALPESGKAATGSVTVNGGRITIRSKDDGIHADGVLTVNAGTVVISECYEGLEGDVIRIADGDVTIVAKDDGVNASGKSGTGIFIEGGTLYVNAGSDGLDSNSSVSYGCIVISGGKTVLLAGNVPEVSIDSDRGYACTGGQVLAVCASGGMSKEAYECENFDEIGTRATRSLSAGQYLTVSADGEPVVTAKLERSQSSALIVWLGSPDASFDVSAEAPAAADENGICWY